MTTPPCEVAGAVKELAEIIASGELTVPRCRRLAEELLELLQDVSWGRGGPDHYEAMQALAGELIEDRCKQRLCGNRAKDVAVTAATPGGFHQSHRDADLSLRRLCQTGSGSLPDGVSRGDRCAELCDFDRHGKGR